jgi:hypothetical protein
MNDDKYNHHWDSAVTLQRRLYEMVRSKQHKDSKEFELYCRIFGKDVVKRWVMEEHRKEKKGSK